MTKKRASVLLLDGRMMTEKNRTHDILRSALGFPPYYGANLDALYDCLMDSGAACVYLYFASAARMALGEYGDALIDTMLDAARENDALRVTIIE